MYNVNIPQSAFDKLEDHSWGKSDLLEQLKNVQIAPYNGNSIALLGATKLNHKNIDKLLPILSIPNKYDPDRCLVIDGLLLIAKGKDVVQIIMDRSKDENNSESPFAIIWEQ